MSYPVPDPPPQPQPPISAGEEQGWGVALHLGGLVGWIVAPLVIWLIFRGRSRMLDEHGKAVMNWQITMSIVFVALWILAVAALFGPLIVSGPDAAAGPAFGPALFLVVWGLMALLMLTIFIFSVLGAVAAYRRRPFRYPVRIPFFR